MRTYCYRGGKNRLGPWIRSLLPDAPHYSEPFTGSAAVYMGRPPAARESISDASEDVALLWQTARDHHHELADKIHRLERTLNKETWTALQARIPLLDGTHRAAAWVTTTHHSFGGTGETYATAARISHRVAGWSRRLTGTDIRHADALDILDALDGNDLAYCDPPYPDTCTAGYTVGIDPDEFQSVCLTSPALIAVSGYPGHWPRLEDAGWHATDRTWKPQISGAALQSRIERVYTNYPPPQCRLFN